MEFEFVYSGIINFINMSNDDHSIIGPSAILIRADDSTLPEGHNHETSPAGKHRYDKPHDHGQDKEKDEHKDEDEHEEPEVDNNHIAFLAFDSRLVTVNFPNAFSKVPGAESYRFIDIAGMEVMIENHAAGVPILDSTFDYVLGTKEYFPEALGRWNPDAVPPPDQRPKKSVVSAWMRFGPGKMSGGRLCPFKWKFTRLNGDTFSRHFAEEAIYSFEESEATQIRVALVDLEDPDAKHLTFVFRPVEGNHKVTLFVGNSVVKDMPSAVRRRRGSVAAGQGGHFAFFNNIVSVGEGEVPALPQAVPLPDAPQDDTGGGDGSGGICGPKR